MSSGIGFSKALRDAIRYEVHIHAQELGDELDGVEEIVGDNLPSSLRPEWESLIDTYGFVAVTKEVKKRFL